MKFKIIIFFLLIINFSFSQQKNIINNESTTFQLISKDENIDFIVFDRISANASADLRSPEKEFYFRSWDFANS